MTYTKKDWDPFIYFSTNTQKNFRKNFGKSLIETAIHVKSDERVLGDSDFVERVLKAADESLERKYQLKSQGYDIDKLAGRVAENFPIKPDEIFSPESSR